MSILSASALKDLIYKDKKKFALAIADFEQVALTAKEPELVRTVKEEIRNLGG